jgi:allantoinase
MSRFPQSYKVGIVRGGEIASEYGSFKADIVVHEGKIAALAEDAEDFDIETFDASGLTIFPGGIDMHTHMREPSNIEREGFSYGTMSAAAGGITTVLEMPQADPLVTSVETFRTKRRLADSGSITDFGLYAAAVGQSSDELQALVEEGALAFKAFMCDSSPGYPRMDDSALLECLHRLCELDAMLIVHAENNDLLQDGMRQMRAAGRTDALAHAESRPPIVEIEAIRRVVHFASEAAARLHVAHVSTGEGVETVKQARALGARVTCETCPQYLLMDTADLERLGPFARCAPAIRERAEVDSLWDYLRDGDIDAVVSDHSPYRLEEKEAGYEDIFKAALGLNIIQTMLPAVLDEAIHKRGMTTTDFANKSAANPARILGLYPQKGAIRVGADADLALWDMDATWEVRRENLFSRHPWTPLEGRTIRGKVVATIRRGEVIYRDGDILAVPGSGRFLTGSKARKLVEA